MTARSMRDLEKGLVGRTYGPQTSVVGLEAVRGYALATNDDNPWYVETSRPGGIIAPPTYGLVPSVPMMSMALTGPDVEVPLHRAVLGEQGMEFVSPIRPGDVLVNEATIVGVGAGSIGETLTVEVVSRTEVGTERFRSQGTIVIRDGVWGSGSANGDKPKAFGTQVAEAEMDVTLDQPLRFAEASGDHNPIHVDRKFARRAGFKATVVHGPCTLAFASKAVVDEVCGGDPRRLRRLKARFVRPVYPGDSLRTVLWELDTKVCALETRNQNGVCVLEGDWEVIE